MLKKIVISSVLVLAGCTTPVEKPSQPLKSQVKLPPELTPPKFTPPVTPPVTPPITPARPQLKAPLRKPGPKVVFKSTKETYSIAHCILDYWQPLPAYPYTGRETTKETFDAKDEKGVTHTFTRDIVKNVDNSARVPAWLKEVDRIKKTGFQLFTEKWGYSIRHVRAGNKMVDIYEEGDHAVINFYTPDITNAPVIIDYTDLTNPPDLNKYNSLFDRGIEECIKKHLSQPVTADETSSNSSNRSGVTWVDVLLVIGSLGLILFSH